MYSYVITPGYYHRGPDGANLAPRCPGGNFPWGANKACSERIYIYTETEEGDRALGDIAATVRELVQDGRSYILCLDTVVPYFIRSVSVATIGLAPVFVASASNEAGLAALLAGLAEVFAAADPESRFVVYDMAVAREAIQACQGCTGVLVPTVHFVSVAHLVGLALHLWDGQSPFHLPIQCACQELGLHPAMAVEHPATLRAILDALAVPRNGRAKRISRGTHLSVHTSLYIK